VAVKREEFFAGLGAAVDAIFAGHPELYDHRREFPWLTGSLGDPFAGVWFIGENPSLNMVRRMTGDSVEQQWAASRGDLLFRERLVAHGYKDAPPLSEGGWHCYITNVAKTAEVVKEWRGKPEADRDRIAEAWAPVLRYELEHGQPRLLVFLGRRATGFGESERLTRQLSTSGLIPDLPTTANVYHYAFIGQRVDKGRGPGHPERIAEWDEQFAEVDRLYAACLVDERAGWSPRSVCVPSEDGTERSMAVSGGQVFAQVRACFRSFAQVSESPPAELRHLGRRAGDVRCRA
jgi:hypothetical protein